MTSPTARRALLCVRATPLVLVAAVLACWSGASTVSAQGRHVVVVGDSVILGAQSAMVGAFTGAGWTINFDAVVNRSTSAGAAAIDAHAMELTDTLVVSLGANDAGNTGAYRQRVEQIFAATAWVPHVYWLTIREVRDYYPAANQAVRDAAAGHPNVTVLDWNGVTAGRADLTSSDGLHLNGAGAAVMTDLVTGAAFNWAAAVPLPVETLPPVTAPPETAPPVTEAPVPPTVAEVPTTLVPDTTTTIVRATTTTVRHAEGEVADGAELATDGVVARGSVLGWPLGGGVALVVVLLAIGGGLGWWALVRTRGGSQPATPESLHV